MNQLFIFLVLFSVIAAACLYKRIGIPKAIAMKYSTCILLGVTCVVGFGCVHDCMSCRSMFDVGVANIIGTDVSDVVLCRGHGKADFDDGVREFEYLSWYKKKQDAQMPHNVFDNATLWLTYESHTPYEIWYDGQLSGAGSISDCKELVQKVIKSVYVQYGISLQLMEGFREAEEKFPLLYKGSDGKRSDVILEVTKGSGEYLMRLYVKAYGPDINKLVNAENIKYAR